MNNLPEKDIIGSNDNKFRHLRNTIKKTSRFRVYLARFIVFFLMISVLCSLVLIFFYSNLHAKKNDKIPYYTVSALSITASELPSLSINVSEVPVIEKEYLFTYLTDISEYEEYIEPSDRDAFLLLINYENILDRSYKPDDLTDIPTRPGRDVQQLRFTAAMAFIAMFVEAEANDISDITVTSGWRSYNTQEWLLANQIEKYKQTMNEEDAYALAVTEIAVPGTSEHQSGLAVDVHNLPYADISFAESESAEWLKDNCYKFGFILRYPQDKIDITKISFEPWHFRFVGRYHASRINELNYCLEEYIEYIS